MSTRCTLHALAIVACLGFSSARVRADETPPKDEPETPPPAVQKFLVEGKLADGRAAMVELLEATPHDQQAQFSLGVVQFLQAVEGLAQDQYRFGLLQSRLRQMPFLRLPVPFNSEPERISYKSARKMIQDFVDDLAVAEATLAKAKTDDVKLPLHFGRIRLDLDGNGEATEEETLWRIFRVLNGAVQQEDGEEFQISFDGGDVPWLRGYCHLLMAMGEVTLAHDWHEAFERTAHLFYPRVKSPYGFLQEEGPGPLNGFNPTNFLDVVALVHLINFPVKEPERMQTALSHLEAMIDLSRESWKLIQAETDDDHEWLPNPDQTGVIPNVRVRRDMIDGWHGFLDEMEHLLKGTKLIPFWRGTAGGAIAGVVPVNAKYGINLRRVFTEPQRFDLVMWVQGTGAAPFLEEGERTSPDVWSRLSRVFGGEFFGFAIWFN